MSLFSGQIKSFVDQIETHENRKTLNYRESKAISVQLGRIRMLFLPSQK